jgi:hypothetical protein
MWELAAVTAVGMCVLGLLGGPATLAVPGPGVPLPGRRGRIAAAALAVCACAILVTQAIGLFADLELRRSQSAVRAGDLHDARAHALAASKLQPWAAAPYLQLALVSEHAGRLSEARRAIGLAIERDREDWRTWLVASGIERRLGHPATASRNLARARSLNPRSALLLAGDMQTWQPS